MKKICILLFVCSVALALDWVGIDKASRQFVVGSNKAILFHGVNAVYKSPPWLPKTDGWDAITSLCQKDIDDLASWGVNIVRLGIMWPGVRPSEGYIDKDYLKRVENLVNALAAKGIYTQLDLHQDLLSRYFCGEGIPDYLIKKMMSSEKPSDFPRPIMSKFDVDASGYPPLKVCRTAAVFSILYLSEAVNLAFEKLLTKGTEINREFNGFWEDVATYFSNNPNVMGYDLINEPFGGNMFTDPNSFFPGVSDRKYLTPIYEQLRDTIRKVDSNHIIFFEPASTSLGLHAGFSSVPGGDAELTKSALSYHTYCPLVTKSGVPRFQFFCDIFESIGMYTRNAMMKKIGCAGLITEMGAVDESDAGLEELDRAMNLADQALHGWIYWSYKDFNDLTTVNEDMTEGFYYKDGTSQKKKVRLIARPYARTIAGVPVRMSFERDTAKFVLEFVTSSGVSTRDTEIYVNKEQTYDNKVPKVTVSGATYNIVGSLYTFTHAERTPAGTKIRITIESA
ncbi:MAG: cellulase family glycosylhydrolase [Candidatus Pacebacteria bacterium]|nr:cellulase family glycosylhydrolase [Candidatus Paceibacterota bacterium]